MKRNALRAKGRLALLSSVAVLFAAAGCAPAEDTGATTDTTAPASSSDVVLEFAQWWAEHDVSGFETRLRRFQHATAGELTFEYQQLTPAEWPSLRVVAQLPVPGDDSAERLAVRHHLV